jgi:hypothetical protein
MMGMTLLQEIPRLSPAVRPSLLAFRFILVLVASPDPIEIHDFSGL